MTVENVLAFLFGFDAGAIRAIAADSAAPIYGVLLVVSAALARIWCTRDVLARPSLIIRPLAASLATSAAIYVTLIQYVIRGWTWSDVAAGYWSFLGLYWATAPCAWLYAIPFEHLCGVRGSTPLRLSALGIVAIWRVALISCVIAVLCGVSAIAALALVMLPSAIVVGIVLAIEQHRSVVTAPELETYLIDQMSGLPRYASLDEKPFEKLRDRLDQARASRSSRPPLVEHVSARASWLAWLSLPVWFLFVLTSREVNYMWLDAAYFSRLMVDASLLLQFSVPLLVFGLLLPVGQPAQRRATHVERMLRAGQFDAAIDFMATHPRARFPANWSPPPLTDFRASPRLLDLLAPILRLPTEDWVAREYWPRIERFATYPVWFVHYSAEFEQLVSTLESEPRGPLVARMILPHLEQYLAELAEAELAVAAFRNKIRTEQNDEAARYREEMQRFKPEAFRLSPPSADGRTGVRGDLVARLRAVAVRVCE